ncbi:MAG: hypothetical protein AAFW47_00695 [Pseudomonadota bacterium]
MRIRVKGPAAYILAPVFFAAALGVFFLPELGRASDMRRNIVFDAAGRIGFLPSFTPQYACRGGAPTTREGRRQTPNLIGIFIPRTLRNLTDGEKSVYFYAVDNNDAIQFAKTVRPSCSVKAIYRKDLNWVEYLFKTEVLNRRASSSKRYSQERSKIYPEVDKVDW